jgi:hypothetical protein
MVFLSRDSQMGVPKFPQLGFPWLWGRITSYVDLWLQWNLKQCCSPCQDLSNGMLHVACTQGNRVDSQLLVVGSQIANLTVRPISANLTPDLSFGRNLCYKCSIGWCKPILDIYASIVFQWYKELFKAMSFDLCDHTLKIWESFWDSNSQHGSSLGNVRVHALTLFAVPRACEMTPRSPS